MLLIVSGCTHLSPESRRDIADKLVQNAGWQQSTLTTHYFSHQVYFPQLSQHESLVIYLEGDGFAWLSRYKASSDPTPLNPVGLRLAIADSRKNIAYLARPCQYLKSKRCESRYWTTARFSEEVVTSSDEAISILKKQAGAKTITLIGYSGGGAIAAFVAARRNDVVSLVTIAGNLDHEKWTKWHSVSPLTDSLNPAEHWQALLDVPQHHFIGGKDEIVPPMITASFLNKFPANKSPSVIVIENNGHECCWSQQWPRLLQKHMGLTGLPNPLSTVMVTK